MICLTKWRGCSAPLCFYMPFFVYCSCVTVLLGMTILIAVAGNINSANCVFCFLSDFRSMRTAALF